MTGNQQFIKSNGFTLIEILVVIAVLMILFFIIFSAFSEFNKNYALDTAARQIVSVLDEARSLTLASKDDTTYGVYFEASQVALFNGQTYSSSDPNNQVTALSTLVTISSISLSGGGSEVVFERITGELNKSGTIIISLASDSSQTRTITIQSTGVIEVSTESFCSADYQLSFPCKV